MGNQEMAEAGYMFSLRELTVPTIRLSVKGVLESVPRVRIYDASLYRLDGPGSTSQTRSACETYLRASLGHSPSNAASLSSVAPFATTNAFCLSGRQVRARPPSSAKPTSKLSSCSTVNRIRRLRTCSVVSAQFVTGTCDVTACSITFHRPIQFRSRDIPASPANRRFHSTSSYLPSFERRTVALEEILCTDPVA